jgi:hypothetical protein
MSPIVLAFVGATLIITPDAADRYTPRVVFGPEQRLLAAGQILGAASMCDQIEPVRIKTAMVKIEGLINQAVDDHRRLLAAENILGQGFDKGKRSVMEGGTDCLRANAELTELERVLGP